MSKKWFNRDKSGVRNAQCVSIEAIVGQRKKADCAETPKFKIEGQESGHLAAQRNKGS